MTRALAPPVIFFALCLAGCDAFVSLEYVKTCPDVSPRTARGDTNIHLYRDGNGRLWRGTIPAYAERVAPEHEKDACE